MSDEKSRRRTPYPAEMRERAVRLVLDHQDDYPSQWAAIGSVAEKLSINRETLRLWVRRAETDAGRRPGLTTDEREKLRKLERENKELKRANEILKAAATFFARELDPQPPRS
jgi:transposase